MRSAPPRSAATAQSTDSTQISNIVFCCIISSEKSRTLPNNVRLLRVGGRDRWLVGCSVHPCEHDRSGYVVLVQVRISRATVSIIAWTCNRRSKVASLNLTTRPALSFGRNVLRLRPTESLGLPTRPHGRPCCKRGVLLRKSVAP